MSRPMVLALVLLFLIFSSQTEWLQQVKIEPEAEPPPRALHASSHQVNEQIIFLQEKQIHTLTQLVRSLRNQLSLCQETLAKENATETLLDVPEAD
ncbi:uncharacterized protein LOC9648263 [Selaginella moellendorffii]|uniref:uncharacterized protein LOC9648263 n=1 Tax=Selaginella moellendorffii TaxID=88036 RepID=UPI000D1CE084|nr:uncharacterized protein LOC9648263 [Selaginella moellendorffii]|eukprot:XP_024542424.1 uncharacterized protein LOC9648263 [Selaginella moellendorffii]